MKTKAALERDIIDITMKIYMEFPELCKYIIEISDKDSGIDNSVTGMSVKNFKEYYSSLEELLLEYRKTHLPENKNESESLRFDKYPTYPPSDDIYNKGSEEADINPEDLSKNKTLNYADGICNEKDFNDDKSGADLDIPGSELDDQQEDMGSEDEENNYYSLGGDDHNDLEEDKS